MTAKPQGVHLVGSVPLADEDEVFSKVGRTLGRYLRRMPDGETGDRQQWVQFQLVQLGGRDEFEVIQPEIPGMADLPPTLKLRAGIAAEDVNFGSLGYTDVARQSFARFRAAQEAGDVPAEVRFQVSLPTPLANATASLQTNDEFPVLNERYERAMMTELREILDAIPHDQLAIQWDVCFEVLMYEGWMPMPAGVTRQTISDHLVRISAAVPADVELGYHFCFGDLRHEHVAQPEDLGRVVELAQSFLPHVTRPVHFIHLPVPIERDDDAYFAPALGLSIPDGAELYIGLVHFRDGASGAQGRIRAAAKVFDTFGVATECGMGRRPEERGGGSRLAELLELHQQVAETDPLILRRLARPRGSAASPRTRAPPRTQRSRSRGRRPAGASTPVSANRGQKQHGGKEPGRSGGSISSWGAWTWTWTTQGFARMSL